MCVTWWETVLLITMSEWAHDKDVALCAKRFIPRTASFQDEGDWCLFLLPQTASWSTNPEANN